MGKIEGLKDAMRVDQSARSLGINELDQTANIFKKNFSPVEMREIIRLADEYKIKNPDATHYIYSPTSGDHNGISSSLDYRIGLPALKKALNDLPAEDSQLRDDFNSVFQVEE